MDVLDLVGQVFRRLAVVDDEVRHGELVLERRLRCHARFRLGLAQQVALPEPRELRRHVGLHHHERAHRAIASALHEQRSLVEHVGYARLAVRSDALGGQAFEVGAVDRDAAGLGAALWVPPGTEADGEAIADFLEASIPPARLAPLAAGLAIQGRMRPLEPHWYLPWIGVRPEAQGCGFGARLLRQGLARADAEGMPCYIEATNRRNAMLYARHGFEIIGVVESPGYPEIIAMWRTGLHEPFSA